jgi:Transposase zinc-ribbon domain
VKTDDCERIGQEFPKIAAEFDERFPDDETCRRLLVESGWSGRPRCSRCGCDEMRELEGGGLGCRGCGCPMSVTAGTPLHKTKKPLKLWFRAM